MDIDDKGDDNKYLKNNAADSNVKFGKCYCGKDRNLNIMELLCATCSRWYHESCIGYQLGRLVPFSMNYVFICKNCSPTGLESFRKCQATIPQMCITAIANLQQASTKEGKVKYMFSKDKEIIPYMEHYWEAMTTLPRRLTQSWYATVQRTFVKEIQIAFNYEETAENGQMYGLMVTDLTAIKPNYEEMIKNGTLKITDEGISHVGQNTTKPGRVPKRKLVQNEQGSGSSGKKGRPGTDAASNIKLPAHGYPLEHPFNKDGYRYVLAEPDPHAPFRQEFDESSDWAGKPIPGWLYRVLTPNAVLVALHDRAPQLKISEDRLSVTGDKGYCMARATHYVSRGQWYWEATITNMPDGSATRLGWSQEFANLQAPLGYDKFGYSWRSRKGTRFHESHGKHYSSGYAQGDTLGFLIILPEIENSSHVPNTFKDRPLVKFKSHLYYEEKDKLSEALRTLTVLPGSKIVFFKNGVCEGDAFLDINQGCYYPTISIHKNATVRANFGPNFKYPPTETEPETNGMNLRVEEFVCDQIMADMLYFTENDGKLRLDPI